MLRERPVRQLQGEPRRRWFSDEGFDLFVFYEGRAIVGFQLCYDKQAREMALTWDREEGVRIQCVDTGESHPFEHRAPMLTEVGERPDAALSGRFRAVAATVPDDVRVAVFLGLEELGET